VSIVLQEKIEGEEGVTVEAKIAKGGPRKLLALDGGGIRGVLTLEVLAEMERMLARELRTQGKIAPNATFVLADYFDYIAGTSTGGIIATGLALGMSVEKIQDLYHESGRDMFQKMPILEKITQLADFRKDPLEKTLKRYFGDGRTLGDGDFRALLMLVMRNATTDSPWLVTNNPNAKYNDRSRLDCNLKLPIWQLVRASTAAPLFFPPEVVQIGERVFKFVDGGMTAYNSPAFQLFLMATSAPYNLNWISGEQNLLLVSVGTGLTPNIESQEQRERGSLIDRAKAWASKAVGIASGMPLGLMYAAQYEQDLLCRLFGKCLVGELLDREVGDLIKEKIRGPLDHKLFTYLRYNTELTSESLQQLELPDIDPTKVQSLDSVDGIEELEDIGRAVARKVALEHFEGFV
jgi:uncharacterized protein